MKAKVIVMPKLSILDPQGVAVREAMRHHGMPGVKSVRVGKMLEVEVDGADEAQMHEICRELLSNPVVEDYQLDAERKAQPQQSDDTELENPEPPAAPPPNL